ncbi:hypothetical protein, partial [Streptococcus hyointestinalis]|uniref:hypothetical protein n=1 Tax=Streptococcus hyointestinalis TaxID=1337 RepID=UPI003F9B2741
FGRMISGHVHLLSILSWGILVYQTSMPFLLHFILQHGSFSINLKDHKLFSGFGGYIWLPDGYRLNTDMETYRKAVAQAYADYLGDGWRVDDRQQGLAGDGFMLTYEQDDAIDILNWLWSLSDDDGWGIELAVSEQNADNLISYFDNIA